MLTPKKRVAAIATAFLSALALGACGDDGDGSADDGNTLTLWHYEGPDSAMGKAWDAAIKEFEDTHPGVKVKFEEKGFEQIQKTAPMVLNSDDAPDLMEYNKGNATAGLLSKQGLLTDLSRRGHRARLGRAAQPQRADHRQYDEQRHHGLRRKWYGIPNYAEYVMVYYNKDLFAEHGVEVPTTFDELVAAMDTFVADGRHARWPWPAPSTPPSRCSTSSRCPGRPRPGWTPTSSTRARSTSTTTPGPTARRPSPTG